MAGEMWGAADSKFQSVIVRYGNGSGFTQDDPKF